MIFLKKRTAIFISGPDSESFLNRVLTCNSSFAQGTARFGAILTPQGKIIGDFLLARTASGYYIDCAYDCREAIEESLKKYKLRANITINHIQNSKIVAIINDNRETNCTQALEQSMLISYSDPRSNLLGKRYITNDYIDNIDNSADTNPENIAYEHLRIALGLAECGLDYPTATFFPADVNLDCLGGIDFSKGCFVGQEVVSRIKHRNKERYRMTVVEAKSTTTILHPNTQIFVNTEEIGIILSMSGRIGLALLRTSYIPELDTLKAMAKDANINIFNPRYTIFNNKLPYLAI